MNAQMTGFNLKPNGDVVIYITSDDNSDDVIISRTMLAGIAEASAAAVEFAAAKEDPEPAIYYVQVAAPDSALTGKSQRLLTYYAHFQVNIGNVVTLPPLPWQHKSWTAEVIGTDRGDFDGSILPVWAVASRHTL
jgi:hypothetical protein